MYMSRDVYVQFELRCVRCATLDVCFCDMWGCAPLSCRGLVIQALLWKII